MLFLPRELYCKDVNPAEVISPPVGEGRRGSFRKRTKRAVWFSQEGAEYERAWKVAVEDKFNAGETVEGEVIEAVKGGLTSGLAFRGFLPASLADLRRVKDLVFMGTRIEARVIEMDRNRK